MLVLEVDSCGPATIPEYCILLWILKNSTLAASKYLTTSSSISLHKSASHAFGDTIQRFGASLYPRPPLQWLSGHIPYHDH